MSTARRLLSCVAIAFAAILGGCATDPAEIAATRDTPTIQRVVAVTPAKGSVFRAVVIDHELEDRIQSERVRK